MQDNPTGEWKKLLFNKHSAILYAYAHLNIYAEDIKSESARMDGESRG